MAVALGTVGLAVAPAVRAQNQAAKAKAAAKAARGKAARPGEAPARKAPNAADPLGVRPAAKNQDQDKDKDKDESSFHYRLKIRSTDNVSLAASYYPGKPDTTTPVVLLVHEKDRSRKDFEDPIADLKGKGLAEHFQGLGFAVLAFDLRGQGGNTRRPTSERDWREMVDDLQTAYLFLLDRHNRGELNLARLGVVALGEGANLTAAWAYLPGGAVSHEGRVTDLAGLVLISPLPTGEGLNFATPINAIAPRIPVLLMAGERDAPAHDAVKRVRANVERVRLNRVELFPSSLHGYKLLRLEPKATAVIERFLESTVTHKQTEWEPRYNLSPIDYNDIEVVRHLKPADREKKEKDDAAKAKAKEKEQDKEQEKAKAKAKDEG